MTFDIYELWLLLAVMSVVALVCERLAHEGLLELRNPKSTGKRYFRRLRESRA